ncbi:unnamed protein product [Phytomonas sp. Hart1]|nr:unnamed protein product [Phytomonas sp. Hart1]|eukprot:CCW69111.1 unnamed protein product [Phytomonas sp. isolate Hart1]
MFRNLFLFFSKKPSEAYKQLVSLGKITSDDNQIKALPVFDRLFDDLVQFKQNEKINRVPKRQTELRPPNRLGIIPSFFLYQEQTKKVLRALASTTNDKDTIDNYHPLSNVKGLYVWGTVGCGKTMLMDLLYDNLPLGIKKKRIHFHQFMLDVQKTSHNIRYNTKEDMQDINNRSNMINYNTDSRLKRTPGSEINLFDELAQRLISDVELLCFDEVAVSDVAHAMILKRLFNSFYKIGLVVIFTSNRPPDDLYLGGLNRGGFLPFIDLVKKQTHVFFLSSNTDHRLLGQEGDTYLTPFTEENDKKFAQLYNTLCKGMPSSKCILKVFGRDVVIPSACDGVCCFDFSEICGADVSSADYELIAATYHTVFIRGVPIFSYKDSDVKNRFLLLIDSLYEYRCKVIIYAQAELFKLQASKDDSVEIFADDKQRLDQLIDKEKETVEDLADYSDLSFQMQRCISRLCEMRSKEYIVSSHKRQNFDE